MNLIAGFEDFVGVDQQVEAVEDARGFLEGEQGVGGRLELGVEDRRGLEHRDAGDLGRVEGRRGVGERLRARLEGGEEAFGAIQEGVDRRQVFDRGVEGLGALGDRFLDEGPRDPGEGGEGAVEGDEEGAVDLGDRGDGGVEVLQRPPEAAEVGRRRDQVARAAPGRFRPVSAGCRRRRSAAGRGRRRRCRSRPRSCGSRSGSFRRTC